MTAQTIRAATSAVPRLDGLAFGLLALLPLAMALVNRSAQPILVVSCLVALSARGLEGELAAVKDRLVSTLRRPIGLCCLAFLAFATISIAWSHHPRTSFSALGEVMAATGAALILHAALPGRVPAWAVKVATIALALGCLTIVAELASGMSLRTELGVRNYTFIFKRSVTAILILAWPLAAFLWLGGKRSIAVALTLLLGIAIVAAHSSATALGLAVGLALAGLALASRRAASLVLAGALGLALLVAPVLGDLSERVLPARWVERLDFAHGRDRIDIWRSFGEVVARRPIGGAGFGTSPVMPQEPVAAEVPPERRVLLGAWHPHNGYLQLWAETGAIGALFAGAALLLSALGIARMNPARAAATAGLVASAGAIMLVGHGLWQGWWSAVLGVSAVWLARLPDRHLSDRERSSRRSRPGEGETPAAEPATTASPGPNAGSAAGGSPSPGRMLPHPTRPLPTGRSRDRSVRRPPCALETPSRARTAPPNPFGSRPA